MTYSHLLADDICSTNIMSTLYGECSTALSVGLRDSVLRHISLAAGHIDAGFAASSSPLPPFSVSRTARIRYTTMSQDLEVSMFDVNEQHTVSPLPAISDEFKNELLYLLMRPESFAFSLFVC